MQYEDAKLELARHAGLVDDYYEDGFLGCLRPYSGIRAENFHFVIESLLSVGATFDATNTIERSIAQAVFKMTVTARQWGVDDNGMLVRNQLISLDDRLRLGRWISIIETIMLDLLAGKRPQETIHPYCEYVTQFGWGRNAIFFVPLLGAAVEAEDVGDQLEGYCAAIGSLGFIARGISDSLIQARNRKWDWYEPHERCDREMQGYIDEAFAAIWKNPT